MLYDYQYTTISVAAIILLIILSFQRRSYPSTKNRVYLMLLFTNLAGGIVDLLTFVTISFPDRFPLWLDYGSNMLYIMLFGITTATFMMYVVAMLDVQRIFRRCRIVYFICIDVEFLLILTTPFTHWIIYYTEEGVYEHGILFFIMYLIPISLITFSAVLLFRMKNRYSAYQRATVLTIFLFSLVGAGYQVTHPRADFFHLMVTMILAIIYVSFENPAYDTYHMTSCLNDKAFYLRCMDAFSRGDNPRLLFVGIANRPDDHGIHEEERFNGYLDKVAELLHSGFGNDVYCIRNGRFVIVEKKPGKDTDARTLEKLNTIFREPIFSYSGSIRIRFLFRGAMLQELNISDDFIDHLIEATRQSTEEELFSEGEISELLVKQHRYRLIEDAIHSATQNDTLRMVYQPIYDVRSKSFRSAEALVRLSDPELGDISPEVFIPIAEKNGSIRALDEQLFRKVCAFCSSDSFHKSGLSFIEFNVSASHFMTEGMAETMTDIMKSFGVPPERINMELTETSVLENNAVYQKNIHALSEYGIAFSIDDYGSGFASVDYLYRVPIQLVKVDKSILWEAMTDASALTVFRHSIDLMKDLGKEVVVEGAENEEMVKLIVESGGDYIQGYCYSRPLPTDEFIRFLQEHNK